MKNQKPSTTMRGLISLLAAFFAQAASLSATPQESDTLIHKGAAHSVLGFRFAPDLNKKLYELVRQDERWIVQSSLWRGYTAVLQIREDKLYLMGINLNCHEPKPTSKEILGYEIPDNGVWADFFTGEIYYGFGEHWGYMHNSAWGDQPKKLRKYLFEDGILKSITDIETEKPMELLQKRIMEDIQMLSDTLREADPEDPFRETRTEGGKPATPEAE